VYLLLFATVFTALFSEASEEYYGTYFRSVRSLFDIMVRSYKYVDLGSKDSMHSMLLMLYAFIGNIFIINYLIATLMMTFRASMLHGRFAFKAYLNQYVNYVDAVLKDEQGLHLIVLTPPPLNILTACLPLLYCFPKVQYRAADAISKLLFWLQNLVIIISFFLYELLWLSLKAYLKMFGDLAGSNRRRRALQKCFVWGWTGPFILFYYSC